MSKPALSGVWLCGGLALMLTMLKSPEIKKVVTSNPASVLRPDKSSVVTGKALLPHTERIGFRQAMAKADFHS
jgi:hypothetical protein